MKRIDKTTINPINIYIYRNEIYIYIDIYVGNKKQIQLTSGRFENREPKGKNDKRA